jgi:protein-tyrosine-phosphatase
MTLYPTIAEFLDRPLPEFPENRRDRLARIVSYLRHDNPRLVFICTHNSRRSHMAQIWAQAAADHFGVKGVETFSGGTEATAFHPRAVDAMRSCGFRIEAESDGENPVHLVRWSDDAEPLRAHSKVFTDAPNPQSGFCAVMTCSEADVACPMVPGADERVATPYLDPKESDGSGVEAAIYEERAREIGLEMAWVFARARIL